MDAATGFLGSCGIAMEPITRIRVVDEAPRPFGTLEFGHFDPGDDEIVIAAPSSDTEGTGPGHLFSLLPREAAYRSIVAHEAAHAIAFAAGLGLDRQIEQEFIAYVTQMAALEPAHRAVWIDAARLRPPVGEGAFNAFILALDPLAFGAMAWTRFEAEHDGCALLRGLFEGKTRLGDLPQ